MSLDTLAADGLSARADRLADAGVVVAMAVASWAVVLFGVGVLLRLRSASLSSLVSLAAIGLMAWPIVEFAPWRRGAPDRFREWVGEHVLELATTGVLLGLVASPIQPAFAEPVLSALRLPFRSAAGFLFGPSLYYGQRIDAGFGLALFQFGQWYVEAVVLFLVASLLSPLLRSLGRKAP